jgi:hypothetical protein
MDRIFMRRLDATGAARGSDTVVGMLESGFNSPAVAVRDDGTILIVWEECADADGSSCGVVGRLVRPTGVPVGEPFIVNTTTRSDQTDPSVTSFDDVFVVAYSDGSTDPPDIDETGVRARYLYPPSVDEARGVIGAPCSSSSECGAMQVCFADSAGDRVCHVACDPAGPSPLCPDGGACVTMGTDSVCSFGG